MSVMTGRGGFPRVLRYAVDSTTGLAYLLPAVCLHLQIRTKDNPCRVYFREEDYDADANYVIVPMPSAAQPYGEWSGPAELRQIWLRGDGGTANVEIVSYQRR